jgi:hypothetical protein
MLSLISCQYETNERGIRFSFSSDQRTTIHSPEVRTLLLDIVTIATQNLLEVRLCYPARCHAG